MVRLIGFLHEPSLTLRLDPAASRRIQSGEPLGGGRLGVQEHLHLGKEPA